MEDAELVDTYVAEKVIPYVNGTIFEIVEYNPKRVALTFGDSSVGVGMATQREHLTGVAAGISDGLIFPNNLQGIISRKLHGALAQSQWFGVSTSASNFLLVIEVLQK